MTEQNQQNAHAKPPVANANSQGQASTNAPKPHVQPANPQQGSPAQKPQGAPQGGAPAQGGAQAKPSSAPVQKGAIPAGKPGAPAAYKVDENPNFRGIVRVVGKDLDGHFNIYKALLRVKGIGATLARTLEKVIIREMKITKSTRVGDLTEEQIEKIDEIAKNPSAHGIKSFLLNRQKDRETGKNLHLLMNDLIFAQRQDIQIEKDTKTYKGWRMTLGQRVRGQHSRTTGRSGFTVGVMKKAIKDQKAAAATSAQDKSKPSEKKK
ncbi:MAG: 30S ribosomal protein S13 [Candidatus Micrarchaeota archaeon]